MSDQPQVPEEAVRVLAQSLWWAEHDYGQAPGADWGDVGGERREQAYDRARFALGETLPAILAVERERWEAGSGPKSKREQEWSIAAAQDRKRAEKAEAALARVRRSVERMAEESCDLQRSCYADPAEAPPVGPPPAFYAAIAEIDAALDQTKRENDE